MKTYPSDLTDCQWQFIEKMMNDTRKRKKSLRTVWNAILYLLVSGCQWRMLPKDYGHWESIYYYYRKWKKEGFIEEVHEQLVKKVRKQAGKEESPSVGIIDSQSSKTTSVGGEEIGYDAGKKIKGRKRHIVADTLGMLMTVVVRGADKQDRGAAESVIETLKFRFPRLKKYLQMAVIRDNYWKVFRKNSDGSSRLSKELSMSLKFFPRDGLWSELLHG